MRGRVRKQSQETGWTNSRNTKTHTKGKPPFGCPTSPNDPQQAAHGSHMAACCGDLQRRLALVVRVFLVRAGLQELAHNVLTAQSGEKDGMRDLFVGKPSLWLRKSLENTLLLAISGAKVHLFLGGISMSTKARSSSGEVRIRVPTFFCSLF